MNSILHPLFHFEDHAVFDEEFVVDNLGCTCKLKTIVLDKKNRNTLSYCLSKCTAKKEVYVVHFHGTWEDLKWTLKTFCNAGLTFYRNVDFYSHNNKTRLLAMDFDGKDKDEYGDKYGLHCYPADFIIEEGNLPGVLVIPSSRCNYVYGSLDSSKIKKYHVFAYTEPYDCTKPHNIAELSDWFSMSIDNCEEEVAKEFFPWDPAAMSPWLRFFSKSVMTTDEIENDPTINVRFRDETDVIFEYRDFTQIFNKDFLTVSKCEHYVPNKEHKTCNQVVPYTVPPFGVAPELSKSQKKEKTIFRDFWRELKEFAGLTNPGVYLVPHYNIGRLNCIDIGKRNSVATSIIWAITFNIYSIERFSGKSLENKKAFALEWFNSIFNATNVDEYEEFMGSFNPVIEYERKREDSLSLERYFENPDSINEKHFYRTVKIGFEGAYQVNACSSREELESVAKNIGMSRATFYRKAKLLGLSPAKKHKPHKSKLDRYVELSVDELNQLVKSGVLNRMAKLRILHRRAKAS